MSNKYLFSTLLACFLLQSSLQNIQAQDYPASPLEKEGYRLIFHDEFEGKEIDRTKWIPEYLPSWSKDRTVCTPTYEMKDGNKTNSSLVVVQPRSLAFWINCP